MKKAIGVLQNRMSEYKQIGSDKAMEYYWSCNNAVNELKKIIETKANGADTRTEPALPIQNVSQQSEQLVAFAMWLRKSESIGDAEILVNAFKEATNCG